MVPRIGAFNRPRFLTSQNTFMLPAFTKHPDQEFLPTIILNQVEQIFRDPRYSGSIILKRFLAFIVTEKLQGKSHLVKEYTIALDVLKKPKSFNPQENCIVRIHAARLRKLLENYYAGPGVNDEIRILLPKGHYVPVFYRNSRPSLPDGANTGTVDDRDTRPDQGSLHSVAVFPFHFRANDELSASLSDGLGLGLSAALMKLKTLTVLSYSLMRLMPAKFTDMGEWQHAMEPRYLFTGDIQRQKETVRVMVQLVRSATGEQIWCHSYERTMGPEDIFHVQDEITAHVFQSVKKSGLLADTRRKGVSMMAVA